MSPLSETIIAIPKNVKQLVEETLTNYGDNYLENHNVMTAFYRENINWIGFATKQGVSDVDFPIYSGLYAGALRNAEDFEKAINISKINGASGISIFTADGLNDEQKSVLVSLKAENR